ncbi:hypothetical protein N7462_006397 [Penicillium macrosclerotiorum]|uniref:uncharacterized protein n=1 Tax=Penicillium macrosclerotiorum TaxID=303699 RepID=UPI0025468F0E|nr:uncharacterized protein N7462_006397 [Penicillium macrosclerotiorum]KAJ5683232.1 hypothetical protein N7462_006397 [Penicillium macrosclerotiorum]
MKLSPWPYHLSPKVPKRPSCHIHLDLLQRISIACNFSASTARPYRTLDALQHVDVGTFRAQYFIPEQPVVLPRGQFRSLSAAKHWFQSDQSSSVARLNVEYLQTLAGDAFVPLELTELANRDSVEKPTPNDIAAHQDVGTDVLSFRQFHAPLTLFLEWMRKAETSSQAARLYLAQCQLLDLPQVIRDDFPTPELVLKAGKGDVYDTNVWIGHAPTYTPLHRDPNPNLFVQLAGQKIVRLCSPLDGQALFSKVRRQMGQSGNREAAAFRGEEMMQGQERALLDEMVWGPAAASGQKAETKYEAHLEAGDALFIPKGWWHSIKGVGEGVTASVNWWFR